MVALKDKEDEEKAKAIEETIRLMEEEERENEGLYECLSRIEKRVNTILAKGENLTIEDVARVVSELDFYSDIYKDVNGIRPHWYMERVWKAMKTFAPNTIAEVQKMDENGTWWDFVCNIK
jgi:signal recognition particle GTPase